MVGKFLKKIISGKSKSYDEVKNDIKNMLGKDKSIDELEDYIQNLCQKSPKHCIKYKRAFFVMIKDIAPNVAVQYGEDVILEDEDLSFIQVLAVRYKRIGNLTRHDELMLKLQTKETAQQVSIKKKSENLKNDNKTTKILKTIKKRFNEFIELERKFPSIEKYIHQKIEENPELEFEIKKQAFIVFKDIYTEDVLPYAQELIDANYVDEKFIKVYEKRALKIKKSKRQQLVKKFNLKDFKNELIQLSNKETDEKLIEEFISLYFDNFKKNELQICKATFSILKDNYINIALKYADIVISKYEKKVDFLRVVLKRSVLVNDINKIEEYANILYGLTKERSVLEHVVYSQNVDFFNLLEEIINDNVEFEEQLNLFIEKYPEYKHQIYSIVSDIYAKNNLLDEAIIFAKKSLSFGSNDKVSLKLFDLEVKKGLIVDAVENAPAKETIEDPRLQSRLHSWSGNVEVLKNGFPFPKDNVKCEYEPTNKSLYLLYNSLPYHSGGYATRAHGLMDGVNNSSDFEVKAVTRLAYPKDILKLKTDEGIPNYEMVDDIGYFRLKTASQRVAMTYAEYTEEYANKIVEIAKIEKPFVIHAASNFYNGLAAVTAAKKLGIKSIYEIRGLWEITRISREPEWEETDGFILNKNMETEAALNADVVITITQALKDEMVKRGVPAEKIEILPNGVVSDRFKPLVKNENLAKELKIENKTVIGFIGSFVQYEGLEYIVDAVEILVNKGKKDIIALMVGDGAVWQEVVDRVEQKGLKDYFIFTGRIPHEEVEEYYSLVDIAPLPRKGLPVCEMVSPLKPFEAMAMEKVVLSSDVAALAEIVQDGYNGMLFEKDNIQDLADKIELLANDSELREKLGKQAREWVVKERDWGVLSQRLVKIYERLSNEEAQ